MKPEDHRTACVVIHDIPYVVSDEAQKGTQASSGTLRRGRVVWVQKNPADSNEGEKISAYAEGIGIVSLDPACISAT